MKYFNEVLLKKNEGESFWVLGDLYTFKVTGNQTDGALTIIEQVIQPQSGPPPHIHQREDEAFYVLEGKFSFLLGDKQDVFEKGSFVFVPKGTLHTFKNIDEREGKLMVIITPAGLEEFFYSIGTPADDVSAPPDVDSTVMDKIMALADRYQMDIVLPDENMNTSEH